MPTQKQRRDAARRHLERQLQRRQEREVARKRRTLIATVAGTAVLAAAVVIFVIAVTNDDKKPAANNGSTTPTPSAATSPTPSPTPSTSYPPAKGASVAFRGVTVKGAKDLHGAPGVTSKSSTVPKKLEVKDLVVGKGKAADPKSTVTVQYSGVLYKNGKPFDSSWTRGQPAQFPLTNVVPGFTQGIGGAKGVPPMKVGGRRIIIVPANMGYGAASPPGSSIPPNSPLVFVVDLKSVDS